MSKVEGLNDEFDNDLDDASAKSLKSDDPIEVTETTVNARSMTEIFNDVFPDRKANNDTNDSEKNMRAYSDEEIEGLMSDHLEQCKIKVRELVHERNRRIEEGENMDDLTDLQYKIASMQSYIINNTDFKSVNDKK